MPEYATPISVCFTDYQPDIVEELPQQDPQEEVVSKLITEQNKKDKENEHQEYINRLAQPKKAYPGGPIRDNLRPKTIVFGQSVNVSQCIEGFQAKKTKTKKEKMDRRPLATHHENQQEEERKQQKTSPRVIESQGVPVQDMLNQFKQMIEQNQQQQRDFEARISDQVKALAIVPHAPQKTGDSEKQRTEEYDLLCTLDRALQRNPNFTQAVVNLCRKHISRIEPTAFQAPRRSIPNPHPHQRDWNLDQEGQENSNYPRNSTVTEKITLERSYQKDYPYSVDSRKFLDRRPPSPRRHIDYGQHSTYRDGMSISVQPERRPYRNHRSPVYRSPSPPQLDVPRSTYKVGQSVAFAPSSANIHHDFDDFSDGASEHNISHPDFEELDDHTLKGDLSQRQAERKARYGYGSARR